jgi:hypothetical protein
MSRVRNYPLSTAGRENEINNIQTISYNDGYYHITVKMKKERKNKKKDKKKWSTSMYMGKETNIITKLFKNASIGVSSQTRSTIRQNATNKDKHQRVHRKQQLPIKMR